MTYDAPTEVLTAQETAAAPAVMTPIASFVQFTHFLPQPVNRKQPYVFCFLDFLGCYK
jgi:hypothetical protein